MMPACGDSSGAERGRDEPTKPRDRRRRSSAGGRPHIGGVAGFQDTLPANRAFPGHHSLTVKRRAPVTDGSRLGWTTRFVPSWLSAACKPGPCLRIECDPARGRRHAGGLETHRETYAGKRWPLAPRSMIMPSRKVSRRHCPGRLASRRIGACPSQTASNICAVV